MFCCTFCLYLNLNRAVSILGSSLWSRGLYYIENLALFPETKKINPTNFSNKPQVAI